MNIQGAVYLSNQIVKFDSNGSTRSGGCAQVIGQVINIDNYIELDDNCGGTDVVSMGHAPGQLTE